MSLLTFRPLTKVTAAVAASALTVTAMAAGVLAAPAASAVPRFVSTIVYTAPAVNVPWGTAVAGVADEGRFTFTPQTLTAGVWAPNADPVTYATATVQAYDSLGSAIALDLYPPSTCALYLSTDASYATPLSSSVAGGDAMPIAGPARYVSRCTSSGTVAGYTNTYIVAQSAVQGSAILAINWKSNPTQFDQQTNLPVYPSTFGYVSSKNPTTTPGATPAVAGCGIFAAADTSYTGSDFQGGTAPAGAYKVHCAYVSQGTPALWRTAYNGDVDITVIKYPTATTVTCPTSVIYSGVAQTPCAVSVTGPGGLSLTPDAVYSNNIAVGTANARYDYPGNAFYAASSGSTDFQIVKSPTTTVVSCPVTVVHTGSPVTPCTVTVSGNQGVIGTFDAAYANNTDVGTATASYDYPGDAFNEASSGSATFLIRWPSTTGITCPTSVVYTGSALTPCSVLVSGEGGLSLTPTAVYTNNINVGPASASYTFGGDTTHEGSTASSSFDITKASSVTTINCPVSVVYDRTAQTPCTAVVTGAGGLSQQFTPSYSANIDVGTVTVSYTYGGDSNHDGSAGSTTFAITPKSVTVTGASTMITYPDTVPAATYDTSEVLIDGDWSTAPTCAVYANADTDYLSALTGMQNAGTYAIHCAGGVSANYTATYVDGVLTVDKATSATSITCSPSSFVYTGSAFTPCTAAVTGANLSTTTAVVYALNINVGNATANATYVGDANHYGSTAIQVSFAITKASTVTTITCPAIAIWTGSAVAPCTAAVTGANLATTATVSYSANTNVGTATANSTYAGDSNHTGSTATAVTFLIRRSVVITASSPPAITYGASVPAVTFTTNPTPVTWTTSPTCAVYASTDSTFAIALTGVQNAGTYVTQCSGGISTTYTPTSFVTGTFTINKAASTATVSCSPTSVVYTGVALTPCTAAVTGAGGLSLTAQTVTTYTNNINASISPATASASYTYAGDANHNASAAASATFTITKAASTATVSCSPTSVVYTGVALTPCTAAVTGANLNTTGLVPTYTNNINASISPATASASYTYAGDTNHSASAAASATFTITKANVTIVASSPPAITYNAAVPAVTFTTSPTPITWTTSPTCAVYASTDTTFVTALTGVQNAGTYVTQCSGGVAANYAPNVFTSGTFTINKAASAATVTCAPVSVVYTGVALTPCTAAVTGAGGLSLTGQTVTSYTNNINASISPATASASYTYAGDANHNSSAAASGTFTITKATSTSSVTCSPTSVIYTGVALTPCTAAVSGANLNTTGLVPTYTNNINVSVSPATANAAYTYAGDANHTASAAASATFTITKATSVATVTCSPVVYTGSALTPCSAAVTGDGLNLTGLVPTYTNNINASITPTTASAAYTYAGDANHTASVLASATFTIAQAPSVATVTCSPVVYTGSALTPCTAAVTGAGGLNLTNQTVTSYSNNTDASIAPATASASYTYAGDANHSASAAASGTFTITKASSTATVTCAPVSVVYTGVALTPCTADVAGAGGLSLTGQTVTTYTNNINASISPATASASYTYAGDANHNSSAAASGTFTITKATATTTVTCSTASLVYTGIAQTPCTAAVTGDGLSGATAPVVYSGNVNVGTATANATFSDANHASSSATPVTFTITPAASVATVTCSPTSVVYTGAPLTPCTAAVTGTGGLNTTGLVPTYTSNTNVGIATASYTYAGDANHSASALASATFTITAAALTITASSPAAITAPALYPAVTYATNPTPVTFTTNPTCALYATADTTFVTPL
ncbi:MAG: MBG domain-containing protein, partial [Actinomycetes bacterium]